jgi:hypothetical protein
MSDYVPDSHAYAHARWEGDGKVFVAEVFKTDDGWRLRTGRGTRMVESGTFVNGKALVKFLDKKAAEVLPGVKPTVSTLSKLKGRDAATLIPECYDSEGVVVSGGKGFPVCLTCPYRLKCGEPLVHSTLEPELEVEESEDVFIARLRKAIRLKYGDGYGR